MEGIVAQLARAQDYSVARDQDGQRIAGYGPRRGSCSSGIAGPVGQFTVTDRSAIGYLSETLPDGKLEFATLRR